MLLQTAIKYAKIDHHDNEKIGFYALNLAEIYVNHLVIGLYLTWILRHFLTKKLGIYYLASKKLLTKESKKLAGKGLFINDI